MSHSKSKADPHMRADVQDSLALPIGERIVIYNAQNKRVEGKIAGYEPNHYIIVRVQGHIGTAVEIALGEKINAHFVRNEFTVAFVSSLMATFNFGHFTFVACQYPARFVTSSKRIGSRVDCLLPVTVKVEGRLALGVITNVSFRGCQISFDTQTGKTLRGLIVGENISAFLNPFQTNAPGREVVCSIKYMSRGPEGTKIGVGFENVGVSAMSTIGEYIKGLQTKEVMDALKQEGSKPEGEGEAPAENEGQDEPRATGEQNGDAGEQPAQATASEAPAAPVPASAGMPEREMAATQNT